MQSETLIVALALVAAARATAQPAAADRLHQLFKEHYAWQMYEFPEMAMSRGDYSRADRITQRGLEAIEGRQKLTLAYLQKLYLIPVNELKAEDQLNRELFERLLHDEVDGYKFRMYLAPIGGRYGLHQDIPQMAEEVRFQSYDDYANYLTRLELVGGAVDQTIALLALGAAEGRTPPQVTLAGLGGQFQAMLAPGGGLAALAEPFDRMPECLTGEERQALRDRFDGRTLPAVRSAVKKLGDFVVEEYIPKCRTTIAAKDLPDGEAYYQYQVRMMTTTEMTPAEIHELGKQEVARIRAEMMGVIRSSDFMQRKGGAISGDDALFQAFIEYLRTDQRFYYSDGRALLAGYRDVCKQVDAGLPKLFGKLPRLPYGVREIPAFMAPDQTTAYYRRGDIRNAEPGYFFANTYALDQRPRYEMVPLALHEAVPGHHLQIALAQEMEGLPEFRKEWGFDAFGEGWALYGERLGIEMGLYEDPYDNFGRLLYEMWRACRLVVDPGMHAFGWSRQQAIDFMMENTALSPLNIEKEVDRYIAWPGQACAYKIGELKIRQMRARAEEVLGEKFDIRGFHDTVLGGGSLPLPVLERRVEYWVNKQVLKSYD